MIKALAAGIADEGGGAVDFLTVAIAFDHHAAGFGVGLLVDMGNRDQIGSCDYQSWHHRAMPEVELHEVAFERRMRIMMEALRARLAMQGRLCHPVKRVASPMEKPAAADERLEEGPQLC